MSDRDAWRFHRVVRPVGTNLTAVSNRLPMEIDDPRDADFEIRRHEAVLAAARRMGEGLREQVELLHRIIEYAVRGADLIDEMRQRGELAEQEDGRPKAAGSRRLTLDDLKLDHRRVSEWRQLRDLDALGYLTRALEDGRAATFERVSLYWVLQRVSRLAREAEHDDTAEPAYDYEIRHGDLRLILDDLAGTVDAIITDPPYGADALPEYEALADVATRILAEDGLLVAMVGATHLPEVITQLGVHLKYRWCGAYLTPGPATRVFGRKVGTKWKPILIFDRGVNGRFLTQDVFTSDARDKQLSGEIHGWGQSESGMADIVDRITLPGQLVVDPFMGGGTTAVVCRQLGRRFIGCDNNPDAVRITRERLNG